MDSSSIILIIICLFVGVVVVPLIINKFVYPRYLKMSKEKMLNRVEKNRRKIVKWEKVLGIISLFVASFIIIDLFGPQKISPGLMLAPSQVKNVSIHTKGGTINFPKRASVLIQIGNDVGNGKLVASEELYNLMTKASDPINVTVYQTPFLGMISKVLLAGEAYYVGFWGMEMELLLACFVLGIVLLWNNLKKIFARN